MSNLSSRKLATYMANRSRSGGGGSFTQSAPVTSGPQGGGRSGGGKTSPRRPTPARNSTVSRLPNADVKWEKPGDYSGKRFAPMQRNPNPTTPERLKPVGGTPYFKRQGMQFNPNAQLNPSQLRSGPSQVRTDNGRRPTRWSNVFDDAAKGKVYSRGPIKNTKRSGRAV